VFPVRVITQANDTNMEVAGDTVISFAVTKVPAIYVLIP